MRLTWRACPQRIGDATHDGQARAHEAAQRSVDAPHRLRVHAIVFMSAFSCICVHVVAATVVPLHQDCQLSGVLARSNDGRGAMTCREGPVLAASVIRSPMRVGPVEADNGWGSRGVALIVVTGGAGFIGSNLVHALNARGREDVVIVDDLTRVEKYRNLVGARVADYIHKDDFLAVLCDDSGRLGEIEVVLHQGACSSTTHPDGKYVIQNNYEFSRRLFDVCRARGARLIYASSAAVYGSEPSCSECPDHEAPLNAYGFSKLLFDQYVRAQRGSIASSTEPTQVVGLRYFNVYGPREDHKGYMASVVGRFADQLAAGGPIRIFGASHGVGPGQHSRDFICVEDVVSVVLWFLDHPGTSGVFNCGTGAARTFEEVAEQVIDWYGSGSLEYVEMPGSLVDAYQARTRADLASLRAAGYDGEFDPVEVGVPRYLDARAPG